MDRIKLFSRLFICSLFGFIFLGASSAQAEQLNSNYIVINWQETQKKQTINIYNQGRIESTILADNSIIKYTYDQNGNLLKKQKNPTAAEPYIVSYSSLSYDIYVKGVPSSANQVQFPTWTLQNDQDDIEWIAGEKISEGLWKGTVNFSKHRNELGTYITHIYVDNASKGISVQVKSTTTLVGPQNANLSASFYEIIAEGVGANIEQVKFPTWTENNGQDDLENPWIIGERINETTWRIRVPFSKHNFETGWYTTHAYAFDKYGNVGGLAGTSVNVSGGPGGSSEMDISGISYDVFIYGVDSKATKVQFPTWTLKGDQDDLEWIEGVKVANGVWKGTVVYSKHNKEIGTYITHIYTDGKYSGAWVFDVKNEAKITAPAEVALSRGYYDIVVEGVPSSVAEVRFPTWTENNGQDDLENPWIQGERISSTSWRIRIPFSKHNNETGRYVTHIYSFDSYGNHDAFGAVEVNVKN
ncbi:GBS Bsp-like repeat-containing protein [Paenibacillus sp. BR2-3]|uniref:GBS Bsp-like repeat-containing protein n=1 Tax=Paenibacillus sp. BR2-3 TaxID=3048494 RepID=UPI003977BB67